MTFSKFVVFTRTAACCKNVELDIFITVEELFTFRRPEHSIYSVYMVHLINDLLNLTSRKGFNIMTYHFKYLSIYYSNRDQLNLKDMFKYSQAMYPMLKSNRSNCIWISPNYTTLEYFLFDARWLKA